MGSVRDVVKIVRQTDRNAESIAEENPYDTVHLFISVWSTSAANTPA